MINTGSHFLNCTLLLFLRAAMTAVPCSVLFTFRYAIKFSFLLLGCQPFIQLFLLLIHYSLKSRFVKSIIELLDCRFRL